MTEINNIHNYGFNKIDKNDRQKISDKSTNIEPRDKHIQDDIKDTGILGRSQVKTSKIGDSSQSINEAVDLAQNNPALLEISSKLFDYMYDKCINEGMGPDEALMNALLFESEFMDIAYKPVK